MKHYFPVLLFAVFIGSAPLSGQEPRLLQSDYCLLFNPDNGEIIWGDSSNYYYNDNNVAIEIVNHDWINGGWVLQYITSYNYGPNGYLNSIYQKKSIGNNEWEDDETISFTYDVQGNRIASERYTWNGASWDLAWSSSWTYDAQGHVLTAFNPTYRWYYAYNAAGLNDTIWSHALEGNDWVEKWRQTYTYDFPGIVLPTESLLQRRENNAWVNHERYNSTYNGSGKLEIQTYQTWDNFVQQWVNSTRSTLTYNNTPDLVYQLYERWQADAWQSDSRTNWTYEDPGYPSTSVREAWNMGQWDTSAVCRSHYMGLIVSSNAPESFDFEVSPNPASTQLNIQGPQLAKACIYDMQGHQVQTFLLKNALESSLQLSAVPPGNYLLQVFDASGNSAVKPLVIGH